MNNPKLNSLVVAAVPRFPALLVAAVALLAPAAQAATLAGDAGTDLDTMTIIDGLGAPTDVVVLPGGRLLVTQRTGDVAIGLPGGGQADEHIDVNLQSDGSGEQGLLGVVADPDFETNHYLYFYVSRDADSANKHKVIRYTLGDDNALSGETIIVDMGLIGTNNHNGGGLFIDDGYLYVSVGDTGHNATPPNNRFGTCLNKANGKILRVNLADGSAPADNPLSDVAMATGCDDWDQDLTLMAPDPRVFAWGFRNPFRFWVDPMTKKLWVGDVGEGAREEISVGDPGSHFGWPFMEGSQPYLTDWRSGGCTGVTPSSECVPVAHDYDHANGRNAVMGGLIMDICGWPDAWKSRYIFGDHGSDEVWTLEVNDARDGVEGGGTVDFGDFGGPAAFRVGPDNALYVVEEGTGSVQRITPKQVTQENCDAPPVGGGGGTGGTAGAAGSGGGATAGAAGSGGTTSGGGNGGVGGANGGNAGTPSAGAGNSNAAGAAGAAATSSDDGGCGCRTTRSTPVSSGLLLLAGALGLLWSRRRGSRHS